ncbi:MarR family winged helix-turn-helix transcriptional regulator [Streptomyces triticirhizae]|uniref:MarR family transcriptional regulator n=1 Tax=Streptomyces triticirhizae TaxID=2483353 RepID=A0A3M2LSK8_9ACTN|nr:MarR family transcriptional regulator [Streptomyces triticirhizae]
MTRAEGAEVPHDDPARTPDRLRRRVSRQLARLSARSDRLVSEGLARVDARRWHYAVLASLQDLGPGSQAALSERTGIHRSDMVGVLNELTERDLVERAPDPDDRRRNTITISPGGRRQLRRLDQVLDGLDEELLAPLGPAERDQFLGFINRLLDHHDRRT